jgi:myo-inositol 2-dehydrogenase/D-chiro-inositol 1-dehydrogenase
MKGLTNCARFFSRRFDPAYSLLKKRVRQGEVGHVQTIKVCSRDSPLPTVAYLSTSGILPGTFIFDQHYVQWPVTGLTRHIRSHSVLWQHPVLRERDGIRRYKSPAVLRGTETKICCILLLRLVRIFYVLRTVHFGMKLYNDQRNAQAFNLFIRLLLPYMFRAFF